MLNTIRETKCKYLSLCVCEKNIFHSTTARTNNFFSREVRCLSRTLHKITAHASVCQQVPMTVGAFHSRAGAALDCLGGGRPGRYMKEKSDFNPHRANHSAEKKIIIKKQYAANTDLILRKTAAFYWMF